MRVAPAKKVKELLTYGKSYKVSTEKVSLLSAVCLVRIYDNLVLLVGRNAGSNFCRVIRHLDDIYRG